MVPSEHEPVPWQLQLWPELAEMTHEVMLPPRSQLALHE
jgi:hypothetical protein